MKKTIFYVEVTDTFGGELNYSWIRRYAVKASSERGAMRVVGNHEGYALRNDGWKWDFIGAVISAYVVDSEIMPEDICRYIKINF